MNAPLYTTTVYHILTKSVRVMRNNFLINSRYVTIMAMKVRVKRIL
jgi:hypothetical protein